jgi:hypothetical protein
MELHLDIETLPTDRADVIDMLAASIKAPAQYKKPESIAQWLEENKASELDALHRKTALDGAFGHICCIGFAIDDEPAKTFHEGTETQILCGLSTYLDVLDCDRYTTLVVGHNVTGFDLRFLLQRYIVNRLPIPHIIKYAASAKPWEAEKVFDTMCQWAGVGNRISLEKLCMALGVPTSKGRITGATVYDEWMKGNIEGIADYCKRDVDATREVFRRMRGY